MSAIALLLSRDGSPLAPEHFSRIFAQLDHRGRDGRDRVARPEVALGHQHFWTTPEEVGERQPLAAEGVDLVFDGRLDNRSELLGALALDGAEGRARSDAALVLRAYLAWEERCFERFLGPFAVAIHDGRRRRVVCGRDALGQRTLFYALGDSRLAVASEPAALLSLPWISDRLDEATLARFFAIEVPLPGATMFAEVRELPAAHVLTVELERSGLRRYWQADPEPRIRYRRDRDYVEHYRELLAEAVRCRLRSTTPSMVMMSGGMDSTAVAALAAIELASRGEAAPRAISWVFDELSSCDERYYIDLVVQRHGLQPVRISGDGAWPLRDLASWPRNPNTPMEGPYRRLRDAVYREARAAGVATVLTGEYGDELYFGAEGWLTDLLREGRWLAGATRFASQVWGEKVRRRPVWYGGRKALGHLVGWHRLRPRPPLLKAWLTPEAAELVAASREPLAYSSTARRLAQHRAVLDGYAAQACPIEACHAARDRIELRRPYRDRRVLEFALGVPAHVLYRPIESKWMLRAAMRGILPEAVRTRDTPGALLPLFVRGVAERERQAVQALLWRDDAIWPRYVRREWLAGDFSARLASGRDGIELVVLWECICAELWRGGAALVGQASNAGLSFTNGGLVHA